MKKIFKYSFAACLAMLTFVACDKSEYEYSPSGEWDAAAGYQNISIPNSGESIELDPTAETKTTFQMLRTNTQGEATVPMNILTNTDSVFLVSEAHFADGDSVATITVEFPNAEVGKPYTLEINVDDKNYVSSYSDAVYYKFTVTRVKWVSLGMGMIADDFFFGVEWPAEIMVRDDDPTQFRLVNPFGVPAASGATDGNESEILSFRILQEKEMFRNNTISIKDLVYFESVNSGVFMENYGADIMMYHPSTFTKYADQSTWTYNKVLSYQDLKAGEQVALPGQVQLAPMYYMDGVGGWDYTQNDNMFVITFPGYTPTPVADLNEDFDWEEVYTGEFASAKMGTTNNVTLYKGTCNSSNEETVKNFENQYGTAYLLASPYEEDVNLIFCVRNGKIVVPEGCELQETGVTAFNTPLYAKINAKESKFEEKTVTLNISFVDAKGEYEYGPATDEVLSNITWTSLGIGLYSEDIFPAMVEIEPIEYEVEILERDDKPGTYRIMNPYGMGVWPYAEEDFCAPEGSALEIWALADDAVLVPWQGLGFDPFGEGEIGFMSLGYYLYMTEQATLAQLRQAGYLGTVKDGVITLPSLPMEDRNVQGLVTLGEDVYYGSQYNAFKVTLPSAYTPAKAKAVKAANKKYDFNFNLKKAKAKKSACIKKNFMFEKHVAKKAWQKYTPVSLNLNK